MSSPETFEPLSAIMRRVLDDAAKTFGKTRDELEAERAATQATIDRNEARIADLRERGKKETPK
jgi:hypothetical protein